MSMIVGKEKFWAALLNGGMVTAATTLALWMVSLTGAVPVPDEAAIVAAVTGTISALFAAFGAYIATNTPTGDAPLMATPAEVEPVP